MILFTPFENLSASDKITWHLMSWDNSKEYSLFGKITGKTVGPLAVLLSSAVDAIAHAVFALIKAPIALVLSPYHFITFCFIPGKKLHNDLQLLSVCKHLFRVAESVFFAATLPLLTLINPEKAYALASWHNKLSKIEELQQEIDEKNKEIQEKNVQRVLLEQELKSAHRTKEQEVHPLDADNSALIQKQINEIEKLKKQIRFNAKKNQQLTKNSAREIEGKNQQLNKLESHINDLNSQITNLQKSLENHQQQIQQKESEIHNIATEKFKELQQEIQELRNTKNSYEKQLIHNQEIDSIKSRSQSVQEKMRHEQENAPLSKENKRTKSELGNEIKNKEQNLNEERAKLKQAESKRTKLEKRISDLKDEVKETKKEIIRLKIKSQEDLKIIKNQTQQIKSMGTLLNKLNSSKILLEDPSLEEASERSVFEDEQAIDFFHNEIPLEGSLLSLNPQIEYKNLKIHDLDKGLGKKGIKNILGEVDFITKIPTSLAIYSGDVLVPDAGKELLPIFYLNPVKRDNSGATEQNPEMPVGMAEKFLNHMGDEGKASYSQAVSEFYETYNYKKSSEYGYAADQVSKRLLGKVRTNKTLGKIKQSLDKKILNKKVIPLLNVNETLFAHGKKDYYCCISGPRGDNPNRQYLIQGTSKTFVLDSAKKASEEGVRELILQAPIPSSEFGYDPRESLPYIFEGFKEAIMLLETQNTRFLNIKISLFAWNDETSPLVSETLQKKFIEAFSGK